MRLRLSTSICFAFLALLLATPVALGQDDAQDVYSERTLELSRKLACPVCDGQSIADSQARLATDMKQTIESKVQAGDSDQEIIDFFVARFGEEVLLEPSRSGINLTLWWIPVVVVALGAIVIGLYLRDSTVPGRGDGQQADQDLEPELQEIADSALAGDSDKTRRPLASDQGAK